MLSGDPKQLAPVYTSKHAKLLVEDSKYGTSFMEYLFSQRCYQPEYNPKLIVKLKKNYRSHPSILHVPNLLFYKNMLECMADKGIYLKNYYHYY